MFCPNCKSLLSHQDGKTICKRCSIGDIPKVVKNDNPIRNVNTLFQKEPIKEQIREPIKIDTIEELLCSLQSVYVEKWDIAVYISSPNFQPTEKVLEKLWQYRCKQGQMTCYILKEKAYGRPFRMQRREIGCLKRCKLGWDDYCSFEKF